MATELFPVIIFANSQSINPLLGIEIGTLSQAFRRDIILSN